MLHRRGGFSGNGTTLLAVLSLCVLLAAQGVDEEEVTITLEHELSSEGVGITLELDETTLRTALAVGSVMTGRGIYLGSDPEFERRAGFSATNADPEDLIDRLAAKGGLAVWRGEHLTVVASPEAVAMLERETAALMRELPERPGFTIDHSAMTWSGVVKQLSSQAGVAIQVPAEIQLQQPVSITADSADWREVLAALVFTRGLGVRWESSEVVLFVPETKKEVEDPALAEPRPSPSEPPPFDPGPGWEKADLEAERQERATRFQMFVMLFAGLLLLLGLLVFGRRRRVER